MPYGIRVLTTYWGTRPELHSVLALAARGDLVAQTTTEWPLSRAPEAYAALRAGTVTGRAVIVRTTTLSRSPAPRAPDGGSPGPPGR
ncbi:hypothetical protein [Geodermatophilus sabuli]|uniref:Alcohol dehydrogenase, propanol-preferring n=1 Tax=Geodermatophilus sabuli TaxID=1564158 RepID=A0A285ECS2_9ACTN|nr:hypothetical protein [Geodermatophilus sabuli]MBB3085705.1 propanol-preferring alcohol dehydrogenase [Geodermatophilus sabuli]SNX95876.1 alcohol dehydrogenase, propanol-preferring [Geodermatophilus sabuli]